MREISKDQFDEIVDAMRILRRHLEPEHLILLSSNHDGFQRALSQVTSKFVRGDARQGDYERAKRVMTTWFFDWLLSFRAYLDHSKTRLTRAFGKDSPQVAAFKAACSEEYDNHFSYRLMYKLRDFAQHCDLPPVDVTVNEQSPEPGTLNIVVSVGCKREDLLVWKGWKRFRPEIEALPPKFPLATHMDVVMHGVLRIEEVVEAQEAKSIEAAWNSVNRALNVAASSPGTPLLLEQVSVGDKITNLDMVSFPDSVLDVLRTKDGEGNGNAG